MRQQCSTSNRNRCILCCMTLSVMSWGHEPTGHLRGHTHHVQRFTQPRAHTHTHARTQRSPEESEREGGGEGERGRYMLSSAES